jgi:hypothetical protein
VQLGPTTRSVLSGPPLAEKLDAGWWATGPTLTTMNSNGSNSSGAAGASNSNSGSQHQLQQHNHHQQKAARWVAETDGSSGFLTIITTGCLCLWYLHVRMCSCRVGMLGVL